MAQVIYHDDVEKDLRHALGLGLLNGMHALEGEAKSRTPVHGAFRSFTPGAKPIGGTLRRSEHSVVFVDGQAIAGSASIDDNDEPVPTYAATDQIVGYVGTNVDYGAFVHNGTVKMAARPFLTEALNAVRTRIPDLILAGARLALRRGL